MATARRATIYRDGDGWRWKVQGSNWRTIDAAPEAVGRRATAERRVAKLYPGVEVVVQNG